MALADYQTDRDSTAPVEGVDPVAVGRAGNARFFDVSIPRFMPLPLRGSYQVLVHQNIIADVEGLSRIRDDAQMNEMVRSGDLVALPASSTLEIDPRLPYNRRYSRTWTAKFLSDLARAHARNFRDPLVLTSAVRTVNFQLHLAHYNGNAAPAFGDTASPHLTGQAVDIGKKGMSRREIAWMRAVLGPLEASGKLDVEEEFEQACFHISVYRTYLPNSVPLPRELPVENVAANDGGSSATGTLTQPVYTPVRTEVSYRRTRRRAHHAPVRRVRRAVIRRRHHRHRSMSLLAAGLR